MSGERTFPTRNNLAEKTRKLSIKHLNQTLADLSDLHSQVKQAHWNLKGLEFIAVHKLLDEFAAELSEYIDDVAERATALGGMALGTTRMAAANSQLPEMDIELTTVQEYVKVLADRYAQVANSTRKAIDVTTEAGDANTADLFTEVSGDLDKRLWLLEAHITE